MKDKDNSMSKEEYDEMVKVTSVILSRKKPAMSINKNYDHLQKVSELQNNSSEPHLPGSMPPKWAEKMLKNKSGPKEILHELEKHIVKCPGKQALVDIQQMISRLTRTPDGSKAFKQWYSHEKLQGLLVKKKPKKRQKI